MARTRWPQPENEDEFEETCLLVLREDWNLPSLERYGHRGERQYGVDLWDPQGNPPRRAVQCKHHAPHKALPPAELDKEVQKALTFPHAIDEYYVLTTGKRSTTTADRVRTINEEHRVSGKFRVTVLYWDAIEQLLSRCPAAQQRLNTAPVSITADLVVKSAQQIVELTSSEQARSDLTEVQRCVRCGRFSDATELIETLHTRRWDALSVRQKATLLTSWGMIEAELGRPRQAANLLLQAFDVAPDEHSSWSNRIYALMLLEDESAAHAAAEEFVQKFPNLASAYAAKVLVASGDTTTEAVLATLPAWARETEDVLVSAVDRAASGDTVEAGLRLVHKTAAIPFTTVQSRYRVAQGWFKLCIRQMCGAAVSRNELAALCSFLDCTLDETRSGDFMLLEAECLHLRGLVRDLLGDTAAAGRDFSQAVELYPSSRTRIGYAQHLLQRGLYEDALGQLERHEGSLDIDAVALLTAMARWNRNQGEDRDAALGEFVRLALARTGPNALEALTHAVHGLVANERAAEALPLLEPWGDAPEVQALKARTLLAIGDTAGAANHAERALEKLDRQPVGLRRWVALVFTALGRQNEALSAWLAVVPEDRVDNDTYVLFDLAIELRRHDVVLSRGAALRDAGIYDEHVIHLELWIDDNLAQWAWGLGTYKKRHLSSKMTTRTLPLRCRIRGNEDGEASMKRRSLIGFAVSLAVFAISVAPACSSEHIPAKTPEAPREVAGAGIYVQTSEDPEATKLAAALSGSLARAGYRVVTSRDDGPELVAEVAVTLRETRGFVQVYVNGQPKKNFEAQAVLHVNGGERLLGVAQVEYDAEDGPDDDDLQRLVSAVSSPPVRQYLLELRARRRDAAIEVRRQREKAKAAEREKKLEEERELKRREEQLWSEVVLAECAEPTQITGCDATKRYLAEFPDGQYAAEAKRTLETGVPLIAKLVDERDWRVANPEACRHPTTSDACDGVRNYLDIQPAGAYVEEAQALLARELRWQQEQATRAQEAAEERRQENARAQCRRSCLDSRCAHSKPSEFEECSRRCQEQCG